MAPDPPPLLETIGLTRRFPAPQSLFRRYASKRQPAAVHAVDDVDLQILPGKTTGIVGESGSGKTTLARCLAGLLTPSAGRILLNGVDVGLPSRSAGLRRREGRLQMVFQDPFASLNPRWSVGRIVAEPVIARGSLLSHAGVDAIVAEALTAVGLHPADAKRKPHAFSGGERQRIAVARALAARPSMVILDEPTASVDPSIQAQILNLMQDLQDSHGLTYLIISHNLPVVHHMANMVGVLYQGRLVETGPVDDVFREPQHPYTQMLIGAVPSLASRLRPWRPPPIGQGANEPATMLAGCHYRDRCPRVLGRCEVETPRLQPVASGVSVACHAIEAQGPA